MPHADRRMPQESIEVRIARCVSRLDTQRQDLAVRASRLRRPAKTVDTVRHHAKEVRRNAATWIALVLPLASMVFRRRRWMRTALRIWGAVRLARGVAATVVQVQRLRGTNARRDRSWV